MIGSLKETKNSNPVIVIYADGACRGNQNTENLGAYAYRLQYKDHVKEFAHAEEITTNNRMELSSVIYALKALNESVAKNMRVEVYTDSQYVCSGFNEWSKAWVAKDFEGVKNPDLWKTLLSFKNIYPNLYINKVKGHSNDELNKRVDYLCNAAMDDYIKNKR